MSEVSFDTNKVKNYIIIAMTIAMLALGAFSFYSFNSWQDEINKLSAKDAQIQQLDTELGLAKSELLSSNELNQKYKDEIDHFPEELQKIINEYNLQLKSKDSLIAQLRNKVKGGKTRVVIIDRPESDGNNDGRGVTIEDEDGNKINPSEQIISYEWEENLGRFKLVDPDIFTPNNEEFTSSQHMKIVGHVLYGKNGQLQIRKVELQEVIPDGIDENGNIKYKNVPNSKVELVDSQFEYTNNLPLKKKNLLDVITLRPVATFDTAMTPGLGMEFANLGRLIDYANVGVNTKISADLTDPLGGSLQKSRMSVGLHYQFVPPLIDTNFAIGASIGVPFNDLRQPVFTIDAILFLTQDLSPFASEN